MEAETQSTDPVSQPMTVQSTEKHKKQNLPLIIVLAILAAGGLGFGGFELWQNIQKDHQITDLKAQIEYSNTDDGSYVVESDGITITVYPPESGNYGGATRYEISGVYSVEEANAALIEHSYNNKVDGLEPDIRMTSQEAQELASEIAKSGCGLITKEYAGTPPPPIDDARMWSDYGNDNYDTIMIYMLGDGKHYAYTDCQNTKK